jgi:hypothetical protein
MAALPAKVSARKLKAAKKKSAASTGAAARMRAIAMALPETTEAPHFEKTSFRVRGKIFATAPLGADADEGVLKMAPEIQHAMIDAHPGKFRPASGAWGASGWTHVKVGAVPRALVEDLLVSAWALVAPKALVAAMKR